MTFPLIHMNMINLRLHIHLPRARTRIQSISFVMLMYDHFRRMCEWMDVRALAAKSVVCVVTCYFYYTTVNVTLHVQMFNTRCKCVATTVFIINSIIKCKRIQMLLLFLLHVTCGRWRYTCTMMYNEPSSHRTRLRTVWLAFSCSLFAFTSHNHTQTVATCCSLFCSLSQSNIHLFVLIKICDWYACWDSEQRACLILKCSLLSA